MTTRQRHPAIFEALSTRDRLAVLATADDEPALCPCGNEAESGSEYCWECNEEAARRARCDRMAMAY